MQDPPFPINIIYLLLDADYFLTTSRKFYLLRVVLQNIHILDIIFFLIRNIY